MSEQCNDDGMLSGSSSRHDSMPATPIIYNDDSMPATPLHDELLSGAEASPAWSEAWAASPPWTAVPRVLVAHDPVRCDVGTEAGRDALRSHLAQYGYAIAAACASPEEVALISSSLWDFLEGAVPARGFLEGAGAAVRRDQPGTWAGPTWVPDPANGIVSAAGIGQSVCMWQARCLPRVCDAFATIWGTHDLLSSFDGANVFRPWADRPERRTEGGWYHVDQGPGKSGCHCVQGFLTLTDATYQTGGLVVVPGSHRGHDELCVRLAHLNQPGRDFVPVPLDDVSLSQGALLVCARAGDLVIWDSRTIHCNAPGCDPSFEVMMQPAETMAAASECEASAAGSAAAGPSELRPPPSAFDAPSAFDVPSAFDAPSAAPEHCGSLSQSLPGGAHCGFGAEMGFGMLAAFSSAPAHGFDEAWESWGGDGFRSGGVGGGGAAVGAAAAAAAAAVGNTDGARSSARSSAVDGEEEVEEDGCCAGGEAGGSNGESDDGEEDDSGRCEQAGAVEDGGLRRISRARRERRANLAGVGAVGGDGGSLASGAARLGPSGVASNGENGERRTGCRDEDEDGGGEGEECGEEGEEEEEEEGGGDACDCDVSDFVSDSSPYLGAALPGTANGEGSLDARGDARTQPLGRPPAQHAGHHHASSHHPPDFQLTAEADSLVSAPEPAPSLAPSLTPVMTSQHTWTAGDDLDGSLLSGAERTGRARRHARFTQHRDYASNYASSNYAAAATSSPSMSADMEGMPRRSAAAGGEAQGGLDAAGSSGGAGMRSGGFNVDGDGGRQDRSGGGGGGDGGGSGGSGSGGEGFRQEGSQQQLLRATCYVCMTPAAWASPQVLRQRQLGFEYNLTTTHWPHLWMPIGALPELPRNDARRLSSVQRRLIGYGRGVGDE